MSIPKESQKVKLVTSIFSAEEDLIEKSIGRMEGGFGKADWISDLMPFDRTRYYEKEMGWPLYRKLLSFSRLVGPENLPETKIITNNLENEYTGEKGRKVNIDPGYLSLERLVLATGKNYTHRIYLAKGIYADLTLVFHAGTFKPLPWTYPDYSETKIIGLFNKAREGYLLYLRQGDNNADSE